MFHIRKDPLKIEPDIEIQINMVKNNESLTEKEKERRIKKLKHKQIKLILKGKGGIN